MMPVSIDQINCLIFCYNNEITTSFNQTIFVPFSFQQQLEEAVDLKCITHGSLKTSRSQFNPESGEIEFSLRVDDPEWQPQLGLKKWDPKVRTFITEVGFFLKESTSPTLPFSFLLFLHYFRSNLVENFSSETHFRFEFLPLKTKIIIRKNVNLEMKGMEINTCSCSYFLP